MRSTFFTAFSVFSILFAATVSAQLSFNYPNFTSTTGLQLNGTAAPNGNNLELTTATNSQTGSVFTQTAFPVAGGFDTTFTIRIAPATGAQGADGMTFCIQNALLGPIAIGTGGGELGYGAANAIENSLVIEFDCFINSTNAETSANHISVHTNGTAANTANESAAIGFVTPAILLNNSLVHTVRVLYVPGTLRIYLDNPTNPILTIPYDFIAGGTYLTGGAAPGLALAQNAAFVGFTAATGGLNQLHEIQSWTWTSTPIPDSCFDGTVGVGSGGPFDVLTINGSAGGILRTVDLQVFSPFTVAVAQPPTTTLPAPFVIWGYIGTAGPQDQVLTPYGTLCIVPEPLFFGVPWLFTLADSIGVGPAPLLPSVPAPWSYALPFGIPFPGTYTIQGLIFQPSGISTNAATTNGIILRVNLAPAPAITNVTPNSAVVGGTITVTGANFSNGCTVTIGGVPANILTTSATTVTCQMPSGAPCATTLVLTNPDGQFATRAFNPNPTITNTVFPSGTAAGGAQFVIIGTGFAPPMSVTIGGNPANITTSSATSIIMTTPPGVTGPATVVVTTPGGCSVTANYTYL